MKITLSSVTVDDQAKALRFYTEVLGFEKKVDLPIGEHRWLTVASRETTADVQLVLEPLAFPPAKTYQKALFDAGIPATSFATDDCQKEYERLTKLGVVFRQPPANAGGVIAATFEDTCGNLIGMHQVV